MIIIISTNINYSFVDTTVVAPLVFIDPYRESVATVVGIFSWLGACGDVNYPDVFASVTQALPWIKQITGTYYIRRYLKKPNTKQLQKYSKRIQY